MRAVAARVTRAAVRVDGAVVGEITEPGLLVLLGTPVLLWLGQGIGAAVMLDGKLRQGASGGAGEIGFLPVPGVSGLPSAVNCDGGFHSLAGSAALCELAAAHGLLALEVDRVLGEARGDVVSGICRDTGARDEPDGDDAPEDLEDERERMRRLQLTVARNGAAATLGGLGRLAHSGPFGMLRCAGLESTPTTKRRVWDSNPREG